MSISVALNIFTILCNHHRHPTQNVLSSQTPSSVPNKLGLPTLPPQPLAAPRSVSVSVTVTVSVSMTTL